MKVSLDEMATFVEVIDCGNLSKAAEKTGIPVSTVSRRIADLEKRLSVQLLLRTTRQQHLTDIGAVYYEHCSLMLQEAKEAELAVQNLQAEPTGVLRMTSPVPLDDPFSSQMVMSFLHKHPKIRMEYVINTRAVDLIEERFDCALIPGELKDSTLIARSLGHFRVIYCVSPSYVEKHGLPTADCDLGSHHLSVYEPPFWLGLAPDPLKGKVPSRYYTNDNFAARRAAIDGIGITRIPEIQVIRELGEGSLIEVLPGLAATEPLHLVFPSNKQFTTKLRAFIDHMTEYSKGRAPWDYS